MTPDGGDALADALLAARLCAHDPGLGGLVLRGDGDARDAVVAALREATGDVPVRRLPVHADDDALTGGLDLSATLASGRPMARAGLLAEVEGGVLIVPMAERLRAASAGHIAQALDAGARFVTVALDDAGADEAVPAALAERLAFWVDLSQSSPAGGGGPLAESEGWRGRATSASLLAAPPPPPLRDGPPPPAGEDFLSTLATIAAALGIDSARAPLFALRAARVAAALAGRDVIEESDVVLAARLVLGPRATQVPAEAPPPPPAPDDADAASASDPRPLDDIVLAAARAAIPADLLARLAAGAGRGKASGARGMGERRRAPSRGRPVGVRAGVPRGGLRLALVDTLRAAAPWQRLRGRDGRIEVRRDDLRVRRFEARAQATTIVAVDASGSAALARLAEAKGAVELLLGQAYVKRAHVALIAFRGTMAETLLPPTRSLARAKRLLADLPGGGGTPLAAGLDAARELALAARARGQTPFVVVLTDGRANVARDGGREAAADDAIAAARAIAAAGIGAAFVDTAARPRPEGAALAAAMGARYVPLPRTDAAGLHAAIAAAQGSSSR